MDVRAERTGGAQLVECPAARWKSRDAVPNTVGKLRRGEVLSSSGMHELPGRPRLSEENRRSIEASIPRDNRREVSLLIIGKTGRKENIKPSPAST